MTLHSQGSSSKISLDVGAYESLLWFLTFMKEFNGVVCFTKPAICRCQFTMAVRLLGILCMFNLVPTEVIDEMSITQYWMYNILLAIRLWMCDLANRKVCIVIMRVQSQSPIQVKPGFHF